MKALLLAAGLGTRLRPLTDSTPKCLVPVNGKPLMEFWFETFNKAGIKEVLVNLHHLSDQVDSFIKASPYSKSVTVIFENSLLGTGGTLLQNKDYFDNDQILMVHGDNLSVFNMDEFIRAHKSRPRRCDITMMTFETDTPESCGIVELDQDGVVCAFHEKIKNPPGNLANAAVYILEPSISNFLSSLGKTKIDFSTEVLPNFINKIFTFHNDQYHRDIGTLESLKKANHDFKQICR